jgi:hypothetical protein
VLQAAYMLKEAGRLQLLEPSISLRVVPLKTGFFRKADHVELAKYHEERWQRMGPYGHHPLVSLRITLPTGPAVESVQFASGLDEACIAIPKEFMQAWGLSEADSVTVRPAP